MAMKFQHIGHRHQGNADIRTFTEGSFPALIFDICSFLSRQEVCRFTLTNKTTMDSVLSCGALRPAKVMTNSIEGLEYCFKHFLATPEGIYTIDCTAHGIHTVHPPPGTKATPYKISHVIPDQIIVGKDNRWIEFPSHFSEDEGKTWRNAPLSPQQSIYSHQTYCCLKNGSLLCTGGSRVLDVEGDIMFFFSKEIWQSNDNGMSWNRLPDPPWKARCNHKMVVLNSSAIDQEFGTILLAGGASTNWAQLEDVWISEDGGMSWTRVSDVPAPSTKQIWLKDYDILYIPTQRAGVEFATSGSTIYAVGGMPHPTNLLTATKKNDIMIEQKSVFWNDVWLSHDQGCHWHKLCHLPWPCVGDESYRVQSVVVDRVGEVDHIYVSATKNSGEYVAVVEITFRID